MPDVLVARFPIKLGEAGGYPGGSGNWIEPGDYYPPIEWGDPDYPEPDDPDYPEPIFPDDPDYPDIDDPDYPGDQDGDGFPDPYHPDYYPPPKTLSVTITGATSGTHSNNIPDENKNVAGYGCGGYGGYGGGGGAGASTIIVNSFATDKADYKEINAIAKRHGYGSGGGKGGSGGDGCIIVYY